MKWNHKSGQFVVKAGVGIMAVKYIFHGAEYNLNRLLSLV